MPVGGRTDVHHINIVTGTQLAEVVISLRVMSAFLGIVGSIRQMVLIHVTKCQKWPLLSHVGSRTRDPSAPDDPPGHLLTRRLLPICANDMAGNNLDGRKCRQSLQGFAAGKCVCLVHAVSFYVTCGKGLASCFRCRWAGSKVGVPTQGLRRHRRQCFHRHPRLKSCPRRQRRK